MRNLLKYVVFYLIDPKLIFRWIDKEDPNDVNLKDPLDPVHLILQDNDDLPQSTITIMMIQQLRHLLPENHHPLLTQLLRYGIRLILKIGLSLLVKSLRE
jgi:hypothetical protein